jgi:hypothetical protein
MSSDAKCDSTAAIESPALPQPFLLFALCERWRPKHTFRNERYVAGWGVGKAVKRIRLKSCGARHERDGIHTRCDKCLVPAAVPKKTPREA